MTIIQVFVASLMGIVLVLSTVYYMNIRRAKPRSNDGSRCAASVSGE
jgi:hypothetical protein